jgi:hypothetical protein
MLWRRRRNVERRGRHYRRDRRRNRFVKMLLW